MLNSPCKDCLTYPICRSQLITAYKYKMKQLTFGINLIDRKDEIVLVCYFTIIKKCVDFYKFAIGKVTLNHQKAPGTSLYKTAIDNAIYEAIIQSFEGIENDFHK